MNVDQAFEQLHEEAEETDSSVYYSKQLLNSLLKEKGEIKAVYQERTNDINNFTIWCVTEKTIEKLIYKGLEVEVKTRFIQDLRAVWKEYELTTYGRDPKPKLKKIILYFSDGTDTICMPEGRKSIQRFNELADVL